jgi:hypothetical protein
MIISNGRVYTGLALANLSQLQLIDRWSTECVGAHVDPLKDAFESPLERAVAACVVDWLEASVTRDRLDTALWARETPLVFDSGRTELLPVEFVVDPFSEECQHFADLILPLHERGVAHVRLALMPSANASLDAGALGSFWRSAIADNEVSRMRTLIELCPL